MDVLIMIVMALLSEIFGVKKTGYIGITVGALAYLIMAGYLTASLVGTLVNYY
ncbi:MAG: hypothetical protein ACYC2T_13980 [Bacillota bacterium]